MNREYAYVCNVSGEQRPASSFDEEEESETRVSGGCSAHRHTHTDTRGGLCKEISSAPPVRRLRGASPFQDSLMSRCVCILSIRTGIDRHSPIAAAGADAVSHVINRPDIPCLPGRTCPRPEITRLQRPIRGRLARSRREPGKTAASQSSPARHSSPQSLAGFGAFFGSRFDSPIRVCGEFRTAAQNEFGARPCETLREIAVGR